MDFFFDGYDFSGQQDELCGEHDLGSYLALPENQPVAQVVDLDTWMHVFDYSTQDACMPCVSPLQSTRMALGKLPAAPCPVFQNILAAWR